MYTKRNRLRTAAMALLILMVASVVIGPSAARAQDGLRYERYDVAIDVAEDGVFTVTATQTVRFDDAYSTAFAEIPTERTAAIRDIEVFEQDQATEELTPLQFAVSNGTSAQAVDWEYTETVAGEARTFVLRYTVEGGLWVYADRDILRWFAVNADRSGLPVENASVSVTLPQAAAGSLSAEVISGNGVGAATDNRARFEASGPLADGEPLEIEVGFAAASVQATRQPWQQAEDAANVRVSIHEVGVGMTVQYDGRLDVTEESTVAVEAGVLEQGYRSISLLYMDDLVDVSVLQDGKALALGEDGCSQCFVLRRQPGFETWAQYDDVTSEVVVDDGGTGAIDVDWYGAPVEAGETTQITLRYAILGGVRVGEDAQVIHFEALPDYDTTTERAWLQIMPPPRATAGDISVESGAALGPPEVQADGSVVYRNLDLPADHARWEVVMTLPPGATSAVTPRWQAGFEQAVAAQAAAQAAAARRTLVTRTAAILSGAAGLAAGLWVWFRYGRKRVRGQLNGYVAEPPSDLAPGIVAYLLDRTASERGVMASLMQLATAGLIEVDLTSGVQIRRKAENALTPGQPLAAPGGGRITLAAHQTLLFNDVLLTNAPADHFVALDVLAGPLRARLPNLYAQMGEDAQNYFLAEKGGGCAPGCLSPTALFVMATVALSGLLLFGGDSTWALLFAAGGFGFAVLMLVLALGQPFGRRRSATGETEAEKWVRFRNYLANIKEYGDLGAAQEILDRHFAYAVALGVDNMVLAQADAWGAQMAPWMAVPTHFPTDTSSASSFGDGASSSDWNDAELGPRPASTAAATGGLAQTAQGQSRPRPSLSGMSLSMGNSLTGASRNLGTTLSAAAGATAATVVLHSQVRDRTMQWGAESNPAQMLDEIMRLSLHDVENMRNRPAQGGPSAPGWGGPGLGGGSSRSTWGSGSSRSGGSSSSGGFGRSSGGSSSHRSSSSSSSRSSSSSSSSRSSGSSGGGRSGFGKK